MTFLVLPSFPNTKVSRYLQKSFTFSRRAVSSGPNEEPLEVGGVCSSVDSELFSNLTASSAGKSLPSFNKFTLKSKHQWNEIETTTANFQHWHCGITFCKCIPVLLIPVLPCLWLYRLLSFDRMTIVKHHLKQDENILISKLKQRAKLLEFLLALSIFFQWRMLLIIWLTDCHQHMSYLCSQYLYDLIFFIEHQLIVVFQISFSLLVKLWLFPELWNTTSRFILSLCECLLQRVQLKQL